ncbi:filament integrity protein FraC [Trichothermofontia sp.]
MTAFALMLWVRLLLIQVLLLLITITIESWVFHRQQKWSQRVSVQYATINNLFATALGWLVFFSIEPFLNPSIKEMLVRISLFDTPLRESVTFNNMKFVLIYLVIFLLNAIIKRIGLELVQALLASSATVANRPLTATSTKVYLSYKQQKQKRPQGHGRPSSLNGTIIFASFLSQTTVCLILMSLINYLKIKRWMQGWSG